MKIFNTDFKFKGDNIIAELLAKVSNIVAVDVGFSTIKVYSATEKFKIPTVVSQGEKRISYKSVDTLEDILDELHVKYNGEESFIGNLAIRKGGGSFSWSENRLSGDTKAAFISAVALASEAGQHIKVVTGLPESRYKNDELVNSYKNDLLGYHEITFITPNGMEVDKSFYIDSVSVYGQAQGAYFNRAISDTFKLIREYLTGKFGVADEGMKTLDQNIVEKMDIIDSGSLDLGINSAIKKLLGHLQETYDMNHLQMVDMLEVFETGIINIAGKRIDITPLKNKVLKAQANLIEAALLNQWGTFKLFKEIIFVGGVAKDIFPYFKNEYNNIVVDDDPQFSVVKGLFKFEAYKQLKNAS